MYSRYHKPSDHSLRLPENYSGVAFSDRATGKDESERSPRTLEISTPSHPPKNDAEPEPQAQKPLKDNPPAFGTSLLGGISKDGFPFAHGIGFEELFIIALIILLSKSEESSDVVLWLTLLLFCG